MKSKTWKGLGSFFTGAVDTVVNTVSLAGNTLGNALDTVLDTGEKLVEGKLLEAPLTLVEGTFDLVGDALEDTAKVAGSVIDTAHGAVKTVTGIPKDINGAARKLGEKVGGERGKKVVEIVTFTVENYDPEQEDEDSEEKKK